MSSCNIYMVQKGEKCLKEIFIINIYFYFLFLVVFEKKNMKGISVNINSLSKEVKYFLSFQLWFSIQYS